MALTKITPQMFDTSAAGHDFNIDNGTFVVDASANRVGIGTTTPSTLLDVNGVLTATSIAGTLTTAAQTNITSLGTLTALTVDDITIDGSTISDGGTLTLDVAGSIILDADSGGDILLRDGGTDYGKFSILNGDWILTQPTANKDILFKGNDGSALTALTLDMSAAGTATFNSNIIGGGNLTLPDNGAVKLGAANDLEIYHDGSNSYIKDAGTGALRIAGSQVILRNAADSAHMLRADDGGAVGLYYNSSSKLETTSTGVTVTGVIGLTSYIDFGTSGNRGKAGFDSNNLYIGSTSSTGEIHFKNNIGSTDAPHSSGDTKMVIGDSGVGVGTSTLNKIFNIADPAQGGETLKLHFEAESSSDKWAIYSYDRTNAHYADMSFGANYLYLKSGGNVGVGITSPGSYYSKNLVVLTDGDGTGGITLVSPATDDAAYICFADGTSGTARYAGYLGYSHNATENMFLGVGGSTQMTLRSDGLTAIGGNHNPSAPLDIRGINNTTFASSAAGNPANVFLTGTNAYNSGYSGSGILFGGFYNSSSAHTTFGIVSGIKENTTNGEYGGALTFMTRTHGQGAGNRERMRITSTGNVGIGTSSPFGTTSNRVCLSVNGTSSISINGGVGGSQKIYVYADANQGEISTVGDIPLRLGNNGGPRMAVTSAGLIPHVADTYDLGSTAYRWANGYFNDFHLSNEGTDGNDVDGTTGDWTIQEGEEHLYIINNKSGKKFRFALEEVT